MRFEYDPEKSAENKRKHGIDFEEAQALWADSALVEIPARTSDEARWLLIGKIEGKWAVIIGFDNKVMAGAWIAGQAQAQGLVHGVLEGCGAGGDRSYRGTQQFHAEDIHRLAVNILHPHEDLALHPQKRRYSGRGHTVLASPCFRDDFFLAHPACKQCLTQRVVYFVRTGMI